MKRSPKAFISYAWEGEEHKDWVRELALRLVGAGIQVTLDQWHAVPGDMLPQFMERAIRENDYVLIVCTPAYKRKSDERSGGVGYEGDIITGEVLTQHNHRKFIPILRDGAWASAAPSWLLGKIYIDLRGDKDKGQNLELLTNTLQGKPAGPPAATGQAGFAAFEEASPAKIWNVPHLRNPNFTGREAQMEAIRKSLEDGEGAATVIQAFHGTGGIGKTQLAIEYAYRFGDQYQVVWWLRAEEAALLIADFSSLAEALDLALPELANPAALIKAVHKWLGENPGWLLIFDNASRPEDIAQFMPRSPHGHSIITSRHPNWRGMAKPVLIRIFQREEAIDYLVKITGQEGAPAARQIANAMGDLPLALAQAAAYIERTGIPLDAYLKLFRSERRRLWKKEAPPSDYQQTVATTWSLNMETIKRESATAIEFMNLCSFLGPNAIPVDMFRGQAAQLPARLRAAIGSDLEFNEIVASLRAFSLLERQASTISYHRLVQAIARDRLPGDEKRMWAGTAVRMLKEAFPRDSEKFQNWEACALYLPHALASSRHAKGLQVEAGVNSILLTSIGFYFRARGDYESAEAIFKDELDLGDTEYEQIR